MPEEIFDNDVVSRIVLEPKDYENGVLDLRKSFQFSRNNEYCESVNCNRLLNNNISAIHQFGLYKQDLDHASGRVNRMYTGYCESAVLPIRQININELAHFGVYHCIENGNNAHCHIKLNFKVQPNHRQARTVAINKLIDCFSDLIPYIS